MTTTTATTRRVTRPAAPTSDWLKARACTLEDAELFFPDREHRTVKAGATNAKAVCGRCPVQEQCLQWALQTRQDFGVWGGLTEKERERMHRRTKRRYLPGDMRAFDHILTYRLDEFRELEGRDLDAKGIAQAMGTNVQTVNRVRRHLEAQAVEGVKTA